MCIYYAARPPERDHRLQQTAALRATRALQRLYGTEYATGSVASTIYPVSERASGCERRVAHGRATLKLKLTLKHTLKHTLTRTPTYYVTTVIVLYALYCMRCTNGTQVSGCASDYAYGEGGITLAYSVELRWAAS